MFQCIKKIKSGKGQIYLNVSLSQKLSFFKTMIHSILAWERLECLCGFKVTDFGQVGCLWSPF